MLVGHYAPALAIKAFRPKTPLSVLFVAVQLADIAWALLVLLDIEKVRIIPGFTASNPLDLYFMPYTHSLIAAALWAVAALLLYRFVPSPRSWGAAALVAAAVFSHWLLDLVVHVEDLPLYGDDHKVGFGVWNMPYVSLTLEIGLVLVAGAVMGARKSLGGQTSQSKTLLLCLILTAIELYSYFGPIPTTPHSMAMTTLPIYIVLAILAWTLDRNGSSKATS